MMKSKTILTLVIVDQLKEGALTKREIAEIIDTDNMQNAANYLDTIIEAYGDGVIISPAVRIDDQKYSINKDAKAIL